jgi:hypothetical protein
MKTEIGECATCGREVSVHAESCPGCGERFKSSANSFGNLFVVIVLAILVAAGIVAVFRWRNEQDADFQRVIRDARKTTEELRRLTGKP